MVLTVVSVFDECFWRADKPFWTTRDVVVCITAIHIMWKTVWINQAVQSNTGAHGWLLWSSSFFSLDCCLFVEWGRFNAVWRSICLEWGMFVVINGIEELQRVWLVGGV